MVKIPYACRSRIGRCRIVIVAAVTDVTPTREQVARQPLHRAGRPARYLPSAQVMAEIASLGPDLGSLAEELRRCLSESADEVKPPR